MADWITTTSPGRGSSRRSERSGASWCGVSGAGPRRDMPAPVANGEPVGANPVPLLDQHTMLFEEAANPRAVVAEDVLEHGDQHAERVVAHDSAPRDARDVARFRCGDGETVAAVDVQHHMDVGAAVADVDHTLS